MARLSSFGNPSNWPELWNVLREISNALRQLSFSDNFDSFSVEQILLAGEQVAIRNQLKNAVPSKRVIVRQLGNGVIDDGVTWDLDYVYLRNNGAETVTVTVEFFR